MATSTLRVSLLAFLALCMACGGPANGPQGAERAGLPDLGPSWIAGSRAAPTAGRLVVGLLLERRDPQRLADLLPPAKLRAWQASPQVAPERGDVLIEEVSWGAQPRTWGERAESLKGAQDALHAQHGLEVVFREVLADEVQGIPLLLVGTRRLHAREVAQLEPYRAAGGRLLQLGREALPQAPLSDAEATLRALRGVLADSPLVRVLPRDPLAVTAQREGEEIVLALPEPGTRVTLEDPSGTVLATAAAGADGRVRLRAPDPALDPFVHHVVAHWEGHGLALTRAWSVFDLVGTVETEVETGDRVHAGGALALRLRAHRAGEPVADRRGRVEIARKDVVLAAADYRTDADGFAYPCVDLPPETTPGEATLRCDGLEHGIVVASGLRLSVVTERPLYKQTDAVHVRLMAHRVGDGRPVPGQVVELALGDAKRMLTTSEHGIASHTFQLTDARVGSSRVVAKADGAEAQCAFRIQAFERPTFTLEAEPTALELRPGESAPLVITARYVNGTPFVGGTLDIQADHVDLVAAPTAFDAAGRLELVVKARTRREAGVALAVQDAEGRRMELDVPVTVRTQGPRLDLRRLSDLAVDVPARFEISSTQPGAVRLGGNFQGPDTVEVGADGRAELTLTPTQEACLLRLIPAGGSAREWQWRAIDETPEQDLVMALDRRGARVGESLRIHLRSGTRGGHGLVHLDVWKDDTPVRALSARLAKARATVDLPLDASLAGVLQIHARFADGRRTARRATVLVTRARALQVAATTAQERHAPGGSAQVDVTVRTAAGEPTAAVLGYWGVDEALLALAPATSGHERIFDVAAASGQSPLLALAEAVDRRAAIEAEALAKLVGEASQAMRPVRTFPVTLQRTPQRVAAAQAARQQRVSAHMTRLWEAYVAAWKDVPVTDLMRADSLRETLQWLVRSGRLDDALLLDPWGTPLALFSDRRNLDLQWVSAGPDLRFGTGDDVRRVWDGSDLYWSLPGSVRAFHAYVRVHHDPALLAEERVVADAAFEADSEVVFEEAFGQAEGMAPGMAFEGPASNTSIGIGGGGGGAFRGRGGGRDLGTGGGGRRHPRPLYVRKDFDPTLCFVPEAIVGPDGRARLEIPLKDSITTWRLRLVASAADGATGVGEGSIRVGQAVHAAPWLAPHLTVGDVVDVPVAVRNEESRAVTARVVLAASEQLAGLGASEVDVTIPAGATGRALFRLRATQPGSARVRITVDTGEAQDRQERVVTVHRDARPIVAVVNGSVTADAAFPTTLAAAAGPGEVRVDFYPSPLAEILSGFEGLIAAPHG